MSDILLFSITNLIKFSNLVFCNLLISFILLPYKYNSLKFGKFTFSNTLMSDILFRPKSNISNFSNLVFCNLLISFILLLNKDNFSKFG